MGLIDVKFSSDFMIMDKTVILAKESGVKVGAHPSLPDHQGFGRREMAIEPVSFRSSILDVFSLIQLPAPVNV